MIITRKLEFDAGHRVLGHAGKCRHLHGHRYVVEISVETDRLDSLGMVVDFSALKNIASEWIDEKWDHNVLLHKDDPLLQHIGSPQINMGKPPYIMNDNPTVENMAKELFGVMLTEFASYGLKNRFRLINIRMYETPNCWADYNEHHYNDDQDPMP